MSQYRPLNNIAYDHLRGMIYRGELEFNRIYSETKLATQLSISRTPIRDALNRLAQERYIDILPNRGFMLHSPTHADILEAYHVRMMIEGYCAEFVARSFPDAKSRATVSRMEAALETQQEMMDGKIPYALSQFWLADLRFHKAPLEHVNISPLNVQYDTFMHIFMPHHLIEDSDASQLQPQTLERHRSSLVEHAAILQAIKGGSMNGVRDAIRVHLDSSLRSMFEIEKFK